MCCTVPDELGLPLIVKPPREGSSIGVTKVMGYSQMQDAVRLSARYDTDVLCEEFIDGEEVTCAVLGSGADATRASGDPHSWRPAVPTTTRTNTSPTMSPTSARAACREAEELEIQRIVLASYRALGCRGWGRADLMIRASDRRPFLLEMNTSPGMTGHSLVPISARAAGISYDELCVRLLQERHAGLSTACGPRSGAQR